MPTIQRVEAILFYPSFNHDVGDGCCVVECLPMRSQPVPVVIHLALVVFQDVLYVLFTLYDQLVLHLVIMEFGIYF